MEHENTHLINELNAKVKRLEIFEKIFRSITVTLELEKLLKQIMEIIQATFNVEATALFLIDKKTEDLIFYVPTGVKGEVLKKIKLKPGQGIAGSVAKEASPLIINDAYEDKRFCQEMDKKTGFITRSILAVPLKIHGKVIGVIEIINKKEGKPFTDGDMDLLVMLSGQIAINIDNARMTEDLKISRDQIREYSKTLETKVKERTIELERRNLDLQQANIELQTANQKLGEAQSQLLQSEKMASIGQLAAGVAHEINNPLGFISSNLNTFSEYTLEIKRLIQKYEELNSDMEDNYIKRQGPQPKGLPPGRLTNSSPKKKLLLCNSIKKKKELEILKQEVDINFILEDISKLIDESVEGAERVKRIVEDLKDFSHVDESELKYADINKGLESTLNIIWNEIKYKAKVIKKYGELPEILCYPMQMNQVFMDILLNAVQAIEKKGEIKVSTKYNNMENQIEIYIKDTGIGISEKNIKKIFDPFFTTKEVGKGSGLGLSIAYGIINKHQGKIEVKSKPGQGTEFIIQLPVKSM